MPTLMGSIFSSTSDMSSDKVIAYNAAAGAATAAQAYMAAALASTTPEVRRMFSEYMTQSMMGHEALMGLMVKNDWAKPYDTPDSQLQDALQQSQPVVKNMQQ
jgi:spore coat protein CotF